MFTVVGTMYPAEPGEESALVVSHITTLRWLAFQRSHAPYLLALWAEMVGGKEYYITRRAEIGKLLEASVPGDPLSALEHFSDGTVRFMGIPVGVPYEVEGREAINEWAAKAQWGEP